MNSKKSPENLRIGTDFLIWLPTNKSSVPNLRTDFDAEDIAGYELRRPGEIANAKSRTLKLTSRASPSRLKSFDIIPYSFSGPVISAKVKDELCKSEHRQCFQFISVEINCGSGGNLKNVFLLKSLSRCEFFDLEKSELRFDLHSENTFSSWSSLVPKERGVWPSYFNDKNGGLPIVSKELADLLRSFDKSGLQFLYPKDCKAN